MHPELEKLVQLQRAETRRKELQAALDDLPRQKLTHEQALLAERGRLDAADSTAVLLQRLAYREQTKDNSAIQLRNVDRSLPLNKQQLFLLSGFQQIGTMSAEILLEKFDTPLRVIEELASAEIRASASGKTKKLTGPLSEVAGIGPTIVEYAQTLLKSSYRVACAENPD